VYNLFNIYFIFFKDNLLISQEKKQLEEMKNKIKIFDKKLKDEVLLNCKNNK